MTQNTAAQSKPPAFTLEWELLGKEIIHRMVGDDSRAFLGFSPKVAVKAEHFPSAFAEAPNGIVLASGLLAQIRSASEFAFVLAHELAHITLGHTSNESGMHSIHSLVGDSSRREAHLKREFEADSLAIKFLRQGNFETEHAIQLLARIGQIGAEFGASIDSVNPGLGLRREALRRQIESSGLPSLR